jgi:hypothetical protein
MAIVGVVLLIFDVVAGRTVGLAAAATIAVVLTALWFLLPIYIRSWLRNAHTTANEGALFS